MYIRPGEERDVEEPKLIQLSGFRGVVLGSSRSCLSSNLVEYPWGGVCTPLWGGWKLHVLGDGLQGKTD